MFVCTCVSQVRHSGSSVLLRLLLNWWVYLLLVVMWFLHDSPAKCLQFVWCNRKQFGELTTSERWQMLPKKALICACSSKRPKPWLLWLMCDMSLYHKSSYYYRLIKLDVCFFLYNFLQCLSIQTWLVVASAALNTCSSSSTCSSG